MSWLPPHPRGAPRWWARALLWWMERRGTASGSVRLWLRAPVPFLAFLRLYRALDRPGSPLPPGLRALVMARVSQLSGCDFCVDLNGSRALARGVPPAKLAALAEHATAPGFEPLERAALAYADAVLAPGSRVPPELRERLRAALPDDAVAELTALVAFQGMSARFNAALDVPAEGACALPTRRGGGR